MAGAVLITIGTKNKKPNTLFSDTANALVKAGMELDFNGPVLVITGFGAGKSSAFLSLFMRLVIRLFLKYQYINKTMMEEIIAQSQLKWGNGAARHAQRWPFDATVQGATQSL